MIHILDYEKHIDESIVGKSFKISFEYFDFEDTIVKVLPYYDSFDHYLKREPIFQANYIMKFAETKNNGILAMRYHMTNPKYIYYVNEEMKIVAWLGEKLEFFDENDLVFLFPSLR